MVFCRARLHEKVIVKHEADLSNNMVGLGGLPRSICTLCLLRRHFTRTAHEEGINCFGMETSLKKLVNGKLVDLGQKPEAEAPKRWNT
jgi:hypothetical protein